MKFKSLLSTLVLWLTVFTIYNELVHHLVNRIFNVKTERVGIHGKIYKKIISIKSKIIG